MWQPPVNDGVTTQSRYVEFSREDWARLRSNTPLTLSDAATIQAGLPTTDKPTNRKIEEFYDNSLVEELDREGFLKTLGK